MWTSKFGYYWIFLCNRISRNFVVYKDRMCNLYITDDPFPLHFCDSFHSIWEYNFLRQLCASKHLYVKFKFRYFHVNFAFGIVEYVYNIDSLSTKQLNNFVVNTYTSNTRWRGYANFYNFFFHFFLESRSKQLFFIAENKYLWKTALLIITVIAIYM